MMELNMIFVLSTSHSGARARDRCPTLRHSDYDNPFTKIFHQYHDDSLSLKKNQENFNWMERNTIQANREIAKNDPTIIRNDENWGIGTD
jgi:hypothetical protein